MSLQAFVKETSIESHICWEIPKRSKSYKKIIIKKKKKIWLLLFAVFCTTVLTAILIYWFNVI